MRFGWKTLVVAAVGLLMVPQLAAADDVEDQLEQMQQRLLQLEDQLQATNDQLVDANDRAQRQDVLIERAGLGEKDAGGSALAAFFERLTVHGWMNASYWYNFNDIDSKNLTTAPNTGNGYTNPFNPDANTFSLDQFWLELEHPVSEEHRAGFYIDLVFGKHADIFTDGINDTLSGDSDDLDMYQMYVQYLAPTSQHLGGNMSDIKISAGKFATPIGAEVAQAVYNWQISRGNVYNMFQPINHVGLRAEATVGESWDWAAYVVNGFSPISTDLNNAKTVMGHVGYNAGDSTYISLNYLYGAHSLACTAGGGSGNCQEQDRSVLDLVITHDVNDQLSTWFNFDYATIDRDSRRNGEGWGVAGAARYAINDRLGVSARAEWIDTDGNYFTNAGFTTTTAAGFTAVGAQTVDADVAVMSFTGTIDYLLTEALKARLEVRWDDFDVDTNGTTGGDKRNDFFVSDSSTCAGGVSSLACATESTQLLIGADLTYEF